MYKLCRICTFQFWRGAGRQISIGSTFLYGQSYWLKLWLEVSTELLIWEVAVLCGLLDVHFNTMWCKRGQESGWPVLTTARKDPCWSTTSTYILYLEYLSRCLSHRPNWEPPPPLPQASGSPPGTKGGTHSPASEGVSQFERLEKNPSTLSTLRSTICTKLPADL